MNAEDVRAWMAESRRRQGLPEMITDRTVLARAAAVLRAAQRATAVGSGAPVGRACATGT